MDKKLLVKPHLKPSTRFALPSANELHPRDVDELKLLQGEIDKHVFRSKDEIIEAAKAKSRKA